MHRQVRRSASAEDRHRHRSFTVKSGDRQVITTGDRHRHRRAIVHSSSSQVKLWLITTRQADTGKFSLPETASYIVTIRSGRVRDRVTHKSAGKWSLPARKSCSCLSSWFGMGSDRRSTHAHVHHRVRNQGECYSSYLAVGLLTLLLSHRLASRATPAHRRWPRRMHPSPLPSIILTLPFHSEFQIPQNGIPHSNFLSHSKVEPLAPKTNIKSTTGYWAPVRIRLPRRRRCCRAARRRPCPRRLAARCVRQLPARLALPRLEEHHPHPGGAHRGHGRRRRAATSSRGSSVYRPARASRRRAHFSLLC